MEVRGKRYILMIAAALLSKAVGLDIDTGRDAIGAAKIILGVDLDTKGGTLVGGGWMRLRGADLTKVPETRDALLKLRAAGIRTCVMLRWPVSDWKVVYLPKDMGVAYDSGWKLGVAYGDLVDAWEVDNEPDLGFVPEAAEKYAAFLKATYLGLKAGAREAQRQLLDGGYSLSGARTNNPQPSTNNGTIGEPIVLMGALGLPPGPWLERFAENDGFNYTDGFNYHYYGYAEDFTAVYRQFEKAVQELSAGNRYGADFSATKNHKNTQNRILSATSVSKKDWPIFLTEIGYGMLGKRAMNTKEGRLRQWRWFKSVGKQTSALRIEAPMAFLFIPYLDFDVQEFGLTVPLKPLSHGLYGQIGWTSGGVFYVPEDLLENPQMPSRQQGVGVEMWMNLIGKQIDGAETTPALAQWISLRTEGGGHGVANRPWTVTTAPPSPVVIDFIAGDGLQSLKRFNGTFVTGNVPPGMKLEAGKPLLPPVVRPPKPPKSPRSEEFMIHVRTTNGNLYEVYPTRMATPEWQTYLEQQGNFTMSFYGRAELPWRLKENKPVSLVVVMYPKQLPATYEFKRVQLIRLGEASNEKTQKDTIKPALNRYGQGKIVLYNFSDKPVTGKLFLPEIFSTDLANKSDGELSVQSVGKDLGPITLAPGERRPALAGAMAGSSSPSTGPRAGEESLELQPGERRELNVIIKVPAERFERTEATFTFVPDDAGIPPARFVTEFFPALEGLTTTVVAELLPQQGAGSKEHGVNHRLIADRPRATEEAPMDEQGPSVATALNDKAGIKESGAFFAQQGASVERTSDGFTVTLSAIPTGKPQRVEVEIPWPEGLDFPSDTFISLGYRLDIAGQTFR